MIKGLNCSRDAGLNRKDKVEMDRCWKDEFLNNYTAIRETFEQKADNFFLTRKLPAICRASQQRKTSMGKRKKLRIVPVAGCDFVVTPTTV